MDEILTREEILGGLPAGRARMLLFLIESKTAHGKAYAQQAMDVHLTEKDERRRESAFLEALALGRDPPLLPRIQDLERFVPLWAHLAPDHPGLRAALAHALGAKYRLSYRWVRQIRRVLGFDTEAVQVAYRSQYGQPLAVIYTPHDTLAERLRWALSAIANRLESLPPFNAAVLLAFFIGFARVMGDVTHLPLELWAGVLFAICLYFLTRGSLSSTITSALVIGGINILLILVLSFLALAWLQPQNLSSAASSFSTGQPFDPQILALIFGVILGAYFGHNSVGNCGRIVLRRDPGGRSLLWGTVVAQVVAMVLYCLWVVAVQGALAPEELVNYQGTSLEPLAAVAGPAVHGLGTVFAILAIGMVSVHTALAPFNAVRERLPEGGDASHTAARPLFARGRFLWCLLPVLLIFVAAEWLLFSHNESFTGVIDFAGVVGASIFAGIFPVLLLAASRRKGDMLPEVVYRWAGHPLLLVAVYLLFMAGIWVHGLVIWQNPMQRLAAVICGLLVLLMTLLTIKKGAFRRRLVVQFRQNEGDEQATSALIAAGEAAEADVVASRAQGDSTYHAASGPLPGTPLLRRLTLHIGSTLAREVKVWVHQVTREGMSTPLPARLTLPAADGEARVPQDLCARPVLVPWSGQEGRVELTFGDAD